MQTIICSPLPVQCTRSHMHPKLQDFARQSTTRYCASLFWMVAVTGKRWLPRSQTAVQGSRDPRPEQAPVLLTFVGCRVAASSCSASHFRNSLRGACACRSSRGSHAAGEGTARSSALAVAQLRRLFFLARKSSRASCTTCHTKASICCSSTCQSCRHAP